MLLHLLGHLQVYHATVVDVILGLNRAKAATLNHTGCENPLGVAAAAAYCRIPSHSSPQLTHTLCSGGMIFTFFKARGLNVGNSLVEEEFLELAKKLEAVAVEKGVKIIMPTDINIADKFDAEADSKVRPGWR